MDNIYQTNVLTIDGLKLKLNGKPFYYQGMSFFNAIYNPVYNRSAEGRLKYLQKFKDHGINALRHWCQWDFGPPSDVWADVRPGNTMYTDDGQIREEHFQTLTDIIKAADSLEMVIEVVLFSNEKKPNLPIPVQEKLVAEMTGRLMPYRNIILQIWNENSTEVVRYYNIAKSADPERIVANSPGYDISKIPIAPDVIGDEYRNEEDHKAIDILTPHTVRRGCKFWEVAPRQIEYLMKKYNKAVIDDEPARTGTIKHGGISGGTRPWQHIEQIKAVRALGAYHLYHHDMFQNGYGHPCTPPDAIPDMEFSDFHRPVFEYLRDNKTW